MSADTTPISPSRFAAALKSLSTSTLHLKLLEINNSIAHLEYSNDQLRPFAEGRAPILRPGDDEEQHHLAAGADDGPALEPDQDCLQAIEENERVIERMVERIALIQLEVQERGIDFAEFVGVTPRGPGGEPTEQQQATTPTTTRTAEADPSLSSMSMNSSPWTDGSIIAGTIRNGRVHIDHEVGRPTQGGNTQGGSLSDEQLRAALERQVGNLEPNAENEDDDNDDRTNGGLYI